MSKLLVESVQSGLWACLLPPGQRGEPHRGPRWCARRQTIDPPARGLKSAAQGQAGGQASAF